jgi:hypothetical protein
MAGSGSGHASAAWNISIPVETRQLYEKTETNVPLQKTKPSTLPGMAAFAKAVSDEVVPLAGIHLGRIGYQYQRAFF